MLRYKRIGITLKAALDGKDEAVETVIAVLEGLGAEVLLDHRRTHELRCSGDHGHFERAEEIDLLLVVGGDGTILRAVRELQNFTVPIVSINRGTIGFLAQIDYDEVHAVLPRLLHGEADVEHRSILHVQAFRAGEEFYAGYSLNEAVIAQGAIARLVDLETTINGVPLATFRADGLIVSTPTGSTAYNLAAGGPIVHPTLPATILTAINPYSFTQKPIVIPSGYDVDVMVHMSGSHKGDVEVDLTLDGQVFVPLQSGDHVCICGSDETVKFLRRKQDTFFETIRRKLKWGERLEG